MSASYQLHGPCTMILGQVPVNWKHSGLAAARRSYCIDCGAGWLAASVTIPG